MTRAGLSPQEKGEDALTEHDQGSFYPSAGQVTSPGIVIKGTESKMVTLPHVESPSGVERICSLPKTNRKKKWSKDMNKKFTSSERRITKEERRAEWERKWEGEGGETPFHGCVFTGIRNHLQLATLTCFLRMGTDYMAHGKYLINNHALNN